MKTYSKSVGLLIPSFLPNLGGMEVGLHNIALRVREYGWEPVVFAPYEHVKILRNQNWELPYKVIALPPKSWGVITRFPKIGFTLMDVYLGHMQRKYGIDFWHVTMGYPTGCAMVHYAQNSKKKINYLIRCAGEDIQKNPDIGYGLRLDKKFDKIISNYLSKADRLIAITDSVYDEYKALKIPDDKIFKIPNGVDLERFSKKVDRAAVRSKLGVGSDEFMILSVGRNHAKKNYRTLINSAHSLRQRGVEKFKIVCIGNGCADLENQVKKLKLEDHIILIDGLCKPEKNKILLPVDELVDAYLAADIFAFPSLMETFGIAIVEAMAAGLPIIVGDSEGCRDVVAHGDWGLMCDPKNADDLAEHIITVMNDSELRRELVDKAHKRAKDFDWNCIVRRYVEIYEQSQQ